MVSVNSCHLRLSRLHSGQAAFMVKTKQAMPAAPTAAVGWFGWEAVLVARHVVTKAAAGSGATFIYGSRASENRVVGNPPQAVGHPM